MNTLAGLNQFRTITRSALAMDGCKECLRGSRGDRVMSHNRRTCLEASTWHVQFPCKPEGLAHAGVMHAVTYVRVADTLAPSSSLPSIRCARGTASTSHVLPFFRWAALFVKAPAPQQVPRDWPPQLLPSVVALLGSCRQSYWLFPPVVRTVSLCRLQA